MRQTSGNEHHSMPFCSLLRMLEQCPYMRGMTNGLRHRSKTVDPQIREQRLQAFLSPVKQSWLNPMLEQSLSSFEGFCEILGLGKVGEYLKSRRVHEIQDWGTVQLDAEGLAIQSELSDRFRVS